jgi:hypothetical protein
MAAHLAGASLAYLTNLQQQGKRFAEVQESQTGSFGLGDGPQVGS